MDDIDGSKIEKNRYSYQRSLLGQLLLEIHFLIIRFEGVFLGHFNENILKAKEYDKLATVRMKTIELANQLGEVKLKNTKIIQVLDPSIPPPDNYQELRDQIWKNLPGSYSPGK